jgi:hypothetical protein
MTETPVENSYISTVEEADALAGTKSSAWTAASSVTKIEKLQEATRHLDALPLRGRKYDTAITAGVPDQPLEFPRIIDGVACGYDSTAGEAIIPVAVKWACLEEAIAILSQGTKGRRQLQEEGVQSFSIGGKLSETFRAGAGTEGLVSALARRYMRKYVGAKLR